MSGCELIVNADDFGRTPGVNRGVARAHERGVVTSTSLMVRWPAAADAAEYAASRPELGLGLHVDLGEWICCDGEWYPVYEVVSLDDDAAVRAELGRQLDRFRRLTGREPTHLDTHQHVHRDEPVGSAVRELAAALGVPARELTPGIAHVGSFYGQAGSAEARGEWITVERLVELVGELPPGVTELGCHPGLDADVEGPYRLERAVEVATLCDPRVREALHGAGVRLRSFARAVTL